MQTDYQLPMLQPFIQLARANMALFNSAQARVAPMELLQGMTTNYLALVTELNRNALSAFAGGRTGFMTLAEAL